MIEPKKKELLEQLGTSHFGTALREYIEDAKAELNNVATCDSWEETVGRKRAIQILDKLFLLITPKEPPKAKTNNYE